MTIGRRHRPSARRDRIARQARRGRPRSSSGSWLTGSNRTDDVAFDLERMGNRDLAVEQVADRLGDDRLAVARRAVDEHRVRRADGGPDLVEHALAEHEVRERLAHAVACNRRGTAFAIGLRYATYWASGTGATPT